MSLYQLLGTGFSCECGKEHHVQTQRFVYQADALKTLPNVLGELSQIPHLRASAIIADIRTWPLAGPKILAALRANNISTCRIIVPDNKNHSPVCDLNTAQQLRQTVSAHRLDILIALGSGVINDLTKWTAFELKLPYVVIPTAASMNGYAAANVAATIDGVKVLIEAAPPLAVIAEPALIENAPPEMTAAGFGDAIAKSQSTADWLMNNLLLDEYYCRYCAEIINELEPYYLGHPEDIRTAQGKAVEGLFSALFYSGIAMTLIGTSAPASGGEHLLSHTLDMIAYRDKSGHNLHGIQVSLGTIFSAALYEKILQIETPNFVQIPQQPDSNFWKMPALIKALSTQCLEKIPAMDMIRQKLAEPKNWQQFKNIVTPVTRHPQEIKNALNCAGAPTTAAKINCSPEYLKQAALHMHQIRQRPTVVDLAWLLGIMPDAVDEIVDKWLTN
ncbi:MAG: iron-containing alcohol dehydrogenase [Planctomycetota bacterium]